MSNWVIDEQAAGHTNAEHLDGVPWFEAPVPSRWHRCRPQTRGWYRFSYIERCACGALRTGRRGAWVNKNERS